MARILCLIAFFYCTLSFSAESLPKEVADVGIFPELGKQIDLGAEFYDESGKSLPISHYFDGKHPVILLLNYYGCPMLCGLVLNQTRDALLGLNWKLGEYYEVVTISIDPTETSAIAAAKKKIILDEAKNPEFARAASGHWHFLVGKKANIDKIAGAVGFRYKYISEEKQYAHGAALFLLSPSGKLNRVLPALALAPPDLKLALLEAGEGKIGSLAEKIFALCYHYDPKENKYAILATRLMKIAGALTVTAFAIAYLLLYLRRNERTKS